MRLGIIADDFTGATDIASFLVQNGLSTIQFNGVPNQASVDDAKALVISLKSRSCPAAQAMESALSALRWLQQQGCNRFYFKYCSTFDSTEHGNIGPVTDALLAALGETLTVISPALPVNGRTVYQGYLFVGDRLLAESGMRHHPVTPMSDSYLPRLMTRQGRGQAAVITAAQLDEGAAAVQARLNALETVGIRYVLLDALHEQHLIVQGEALKDRRLVTGGSGLAIGIARAWGTSPHSEDAQQAGRPQGTRAVVLSGSCSQMTNRQVQAYRQQAPSLSISVARCVDNAEGYARELSDWVAANSDQALAPLLFATADEDQLRTIQQQYGAARSSEAVEQVFAAVARELKQCGWQRFIVAGGWWPKAWAPPRFISARQFLPACRGCAISSSRCRWP